MPVKMNEKFIDLLYSSQTLPSTRKVLLKRLEKRADYQPRAIRPALYVVLQAALGRLIPQSDRAEPVDTAARLDEQHFLGHGDGWRYADMPPHMESLELGLGLLEQGAFRCYDIAFAQLSPDRQDSLLGEVQRGEVRWSALDSQRWFEELLTTAASAFVSHPATLAEIGFSGIHLGWERIGLNEGESWEPEARQTDTHRT